ncbi:MAG: single-stranded-DNA-specific exonuclease RecJ [Clostridiales bacterium]|nr:single-stranded-DNA-specific exonuclease RecJ [Clostridiales bacterium]
MKWILRGSKKGSALMAEDLGISPVSAAFLFNRGITSRGAALSYLNPKLEDFGNISELEEFKRACEIIRISINNNEKITVYGDYDADGVMSTAILIKGLRGLGAKAEYYIPDRFSEGYGLNMRAVKKLKDGGTDLIICCDNGISATEECGYIKALGMKLVILDHHSPHKTEDKELLPEADALIDMKISGCGYSFREFCAGGLCYRFIRGLYDSLNKQIEREAELFIFAAIATLCDMVELKGENRVIAHMGLRLLNSEKNTNPGIREIITIQGVLGKKITDYTVGFIIGPFINSAGRMGKAADYMDIFLSDDLTRVRELADRLKILNESRKNLTEEACKKVLGSVSEENPDKVIVAYEPDIHESIAGLAAGKIKERFSRPAIILTDGEEYVKGSGRSVEVYDMFKAVDGCRDLLVRFGGHRQAVGLTLRKENIAELRRRLNEGCSLNTEDMEEKIYIDKELGFSQISLELCSELEKMKPFGEGNSAPVFAARGVYIKCIRFVGKNRNFVQFVFFHEKRELRGVGFGIFDKLKSFVISEYGLDKWEEVYSGNGVMQFFADIVFQIEKNVYNGKVSVQISLIDFRKS